MWLSLAFGLNKFMRYLSIVLLLPFFAYADPAVVKELSKHGNEFSAYVLPANDEDIIVVRRRGPRDIAQLNLLSKDNQQGGHVENIQWSDKGKFLVFTTSSSGGHSPWNFRTYIFSTDRWEFLTLDDAVAPVTSSTFSFTDASHLQIDILKSKTASTDDSEKRIIDLDALPWKTPKTEQDAAASRDASLSYDRLSFPSTSLQSLCAHSE